MPRLRYRRALITLLPSLAVAVLGVASAAPATPAPLTAPASVLSYHQARVPGGLKAQHGTIDPNGGALHPGCSIAKDPNGNCGDTAKRSTIRPDCGAAHTSDGGCAPKPSTIRPDCTGATEPNGGCSGEAGGSMHSDSSATMDPNGGTMHTDFGPGHTSDGSAMNADFGPGHTSDGSAMNADFGAGQSSDGGILQP
jgi:hypothetical protein